jgi:abhydrolase domain-containing protein 17
VPFVANLIRRQNRPRERKKKIIFNFSYKLQKMDKIRIKRLLIGDLSFKRLFRSMIAIPIIIYLVLLLFGLFFAEKLIFQPRPSSYRDNQEILKLNTEDGVEISAIYLPNPNAIYTILYSHGNAEDMGDILPELREIRESGFSIFTYDYHGYGTSQGIPSEGNTYKDIDAAYEYLTVKLGISPSHIISFGHSVGGGPAVDLAYRRPLAGLILENTFTTAFRVLTRIPILPFDKFRNIEKIKKVKCPILIVHGKEDQIIPVWHGEKLYESANEPKQMRIIEEAGHNNIMMVGGKPYKEAIKEFSLSITKMNENK